MLRQRLRRGVHSDDLLGGQGPLRRATAEIERSGLVGRCRLKTEPTSTINVYRGEPNGHTGLSPIHVSPGN